MKRNGHFPESNSQKTLATLATLDAAKIYRGFLVAMSWSLSLTSVKSLATTWKPQQEIRRLSRRTDSVSLPRALAERLEARSYASGVTLSDVLRRAIEDYDEQSSPSPASPSPPSAGPPSLTSSGGFPWQ